LTKATFDLSFLQEADLVGTNLIVSSASEAVVDFLTPFNSHELKILHNKQTGLSKAGLQYVIKEEYVDYFKVRPAALKQKMTLAKVEGRAVLERTLGTYPWNVPLERTLGMYPWNVPLERTIGTYPWKVPLEGTLRTYSWNPPLERTLRTYPSPVSSEISHSLPFKFKN
jgi:hypothetical protein